MTDLYETLGTNKKASQADIKRAYKRKAAKLHPDRIDGDTDAMAAVNHAYAVLSDGSRRKRYDETGNAGNVREPTIRDRAIATICEAFSQFIDKTAGKTNVDLMAEFRKMIKHGLGETESELLKMKQHLSNLKKSQKRTKPGKGSALLMGVYDTKIRDINRHIETLNEKIAVLNEGISLIDGYEYEFDKGIVFQENATDHSSGFYFIGNIT